MKPPSFWFSPPTQNSLAQNSLAKLLLHPFGRVYHWQVWKRQQKRPICRPSVPVVCVGNITLGGSGKTPTVMALAAYLQQHGHQPAILSRGYGGRLRGPHQVKQTDLAIDVGDEPVLLRQIVPCFVGRDRQKTAQMAIETGATCLIMDDGFQNPTLSKDISILVFDGGVGLGNGAVFPAGPLRQSLVSALPKADLCLIIGADNTDLERQIHQIDADMPCLTAHLRAVCGTEKLAYLQKQEIFAFAGIGRPSKFYDSLKDLQMTLTGTQDFADHYVYCDQDLERLFEQAAGRVLVTTEKDWVRLPVARRDKIEYIPVTLRLASDQNWSSYFASLI